MSFYRSLLGYFILIIFLLLASLIWGIQASAGDLQLAWNDNSNNEDGFEIERKTGTGTFALIATLGRNVASYADTNLSDGATYCYRVRAFNSVGKSAYTPEGCATTRPTVQNFTLTVSKIGTGNGTVTSSLSGINCGPDCDEADPSGTTVTLTATAAAGSIFTGWSGDSDCTDGSVTVNANKACTATFNAAPQTFALNVHVVKAISSAGTGNGTVSSNPAGINCGSDCSESYTSGSVVVLTATPSAGSVFSGWSGSGCSTGSVTMSSNRNCSAAFNAQPVQTFSLSVNKTGSGNGSVTSNPAGINCGGDCSESYTSGSLVLLTATAAAGSVFSGWTGSGCGTGSVTMNGSRSCTAVFNTHATQQVSRIGIFRPSVGGWYFDSGNGTSDGCGVDACFAFGMSGDVPVLHDYDGDGKTDIAVYRDGMWYVLRSSDGGVMAVGWGGLAQDIPVSRDYDGDGKADITVYRDGTWYILRSSDGEVRATGWGGLAQDIPVPGDYDGDGKVDIAVYRDGTWHVLRSSDGRATATGWGGMEHDIRVPADYDGDGKTDIAIYRTGKWYILRSSDGGVSYVELGGAADDLPLN